MHDKPACKEVSAGPIYSKIVTQKILFSNMPYIFMSGNLQSTQPAQGKFQIKDPVRSRDLQSTGAGSKVGR